MKVAGALVCAAVVLYPAVATAEINADLRVPRGWVKLAGTHPGQRSWRRNRELLDLEIQDNSKRLSLASFMHDVVLPASNSRGAHVIRSGRTTTCAGRLQAGRVVLSLPVQAGTRAVVEAVVTVSGSHAYVASYARASTSPPRLDAQRAIRTLCLRRS